MDNLMKVFGIVLLCDVSSAETKVAVAPRSTMATSELTKSFASFCPSVSVVRDEESADYVIEADREKETEYFKHYRLTLFDKHGKAVFSTDKHSPGAAAKEVYHFLMGSK